MRERDDLGVYPRPLQDPLPVWIAVGGAPESAVRPGRLGLPTDSHGFVAVTSQEAADAAVRAELARRGLALAVDE